MFLTKEKHWDYEKELRLLLPVGAGTRKKIEDDVVGSVILGCRNSSEDRQKVISILKRKSVHIPFFQARVSKTKFALEFDEVRY